MIWRQCRSSDVEELQSFSCTERPERPRPGNWQPTHPRIWEYEVQSALRGLGAPVRLPHHLFCLEDAGGIAGLAHWIEEDGAGVVDLAEMAVALRHRRDGGAVAAELMVQTLDEIAAQAMAQGIGEVAVLGRIWHENTPSQRLAARSGFAHTGHGAPGVQEWSTRILVGGADQA